jgi:hypothetical protein
MDVQRSDDLIEFHELYLYGDTRKEAGLWRSDIAGDAGDLTPDPFPSEPSPHRPRRTRAFFTEA